MRGHSDFVMFVDNVARGRISRDLLFFLNFCLDHGEVSTTSVPNSHPLFSSYGY